MRHTTLYKSTDGRTQTWSMDLDSSKGRYRSHSGQMHGATTTSAWTQCEPRNEGRSNARTAQQQAAFEVDAHYKRKIKDGYRESLDEALNLFDFKPMLAKKYEDYPLDPEDLVYLQPKLDGIRCIATAKGLRTRGGEPIVSCPHVVDALTPIFEEYPELHLDGELYNHELHDDFNAIVSLVKTQQSTAAHHAKTAAVVEYHIYDCFIPSDHAALFSKRRHLLVDIERGLEGLSFASSVVFVDTPGPRLPGVVDSLYAHFLDVGYEGMMVRHDTPYAQKRTKHLLKRKEFVDSEFTVVDLLEGKGNAAGGAKVAVLRLDTDRSKTFKADVMGTVAERKHYLKNRDKIIGCKATVKYFKQRTPAGIPRFGKVKTLWGPDGKI